MKKDKERQLIADFPNLYRNYTNPYYGFPGNGWYEIIRELSEKLEPLCAANSECYAVQIKEKLGGLRFYISSFHTDEMTAPPGTVLITHKNFIEEAEAKSFKTCENCGKPGKAKKNPRGWLKTLCDDCDEVNWRDD